MSNIVPIRKADGLVALAEGKRWLAEARDVLTVVDFRDKAKAVEHYLRQRDDSVAAAIDAAELRLRAERRLGELLDDQLRHQGGKPGHDEPVSTYRSLGVEPTAGKRWQQAAAVPELLFNALVQDARTAQDVDRLTSTAVRRLGSQKRALQQMERRAEAGSRGAPTGWRVIHGDCLDVLPGLARNEARLVFADPPYNLGLDYGAGTDDALPDADYLAWCERWLAACRDLLAPDGSMWVLISDEYAAEYGVALKRLGLTVRNWVKWYETFGVNCAGKFNRTSRHLFYCVKHPRRFVFRADAVRRPSDRQSKYDDARANPDGKVWDDVWQIPRLTGTCAERIPEFPTQLPLALLRPVIGCASEPGDLVLDPFSSSATTGVAAVEAGRRYVGVEKNARFVELSTLRLKGVRRDSV